MASACTPRSSWPVVLLIAKERVMVAPLAVSLSLIAWAIAVTSGFESMTSAYQTILPFNRFGSSAGAPLDEPPDELPDEALPAVDSAESEVDIDDSADPDDPADEDPADEDPADEDPVSPAVVAAAVVAEVDPDPVELEQATPRSSRLAVVAASTRRRTFIVASLFPDGGRWSRFASEERTNCFHLHAGAIARHVSHRDLVDRGDPDPGRVGTGVDGGIRCRSLGLGQTLLAARVVVAHRPVDRPRRLGDGRADRIGDAGVRMPDHLGHTLD